MGLRQVGGGWLSQEPDSLVPEDIEFTSVSATKPTEEQLRSLAIRVESCEMRQINHHVAKKGKLLGMGSGQPNRVNSVRIALEKAGDDVEGSILASDAFFPFAWGDSVEKTCQAGASKPSLIDGIYERPRRHRLLRQVWRRLGHHRCQTL